MHSKVAGESAFILPCRVVPTNLQPSIVARKSITNIATDTAAAGELKTLLSSNLANANPPITNLAIEAREFVG